MLRLKIYMKIWSRVYQALDLIQTMLKSRINNNSNSEFIIGIFSENGINVINNSLKDDQTSSQIISTTSIPVKSLF